MKKKPTKKQTRVIIEMRGGKKIAFSGSVNALGSLVDAFAQGVKIEAIYGY